MGSESFKSPSNASRKRSPDEDLEVREDFGLLWTREKASRKMHAGWKRDTGKYIERPIKQRRRKQWCCACECITDHYDDSECRSCQHHVCLDCTVKQTDYAAKEGNLPQKEQ